MPRKLPNPARSRAEQVRHWSKKVETIEDAIRDGWSTFWISKEFSVPPAAVRELKRRMG